MLVGASPITGSLNVLNGEDRSAGAWVSMGGLLVAAAEMCIASGLGLIIGEEYFMTDDAFIERLGRYLVELKDIEQHAIPGTGSCGGATARSSANALSPWPALSVR